MTDQIQALLHDFYESFFPLPSQFERGSMTSLRGKELANEKIMEMEKVEEKTTWKWYGTLFGCFAIMGIIFITKIL